MVFDETSQEWKARYGYKRVNDINDIPVIEAKAGDEQYDDPFQRLEQEKVGKQSEGGFFIASDSQTHFPLFSAPRTRSKSIPFLVACYKVQQQLLVVVFASEFASTVWRIPKTIFSNSHSPLCLCLLLQCAQKKRVEKNKKSRVKNLKLAAKEGAVPSTLALSTSLQKRSTAGIDHMVESRRLAAAPREEPGKASADISAGPGLCLVTHTFFCTRRWFLTVQASLES